jgi:hypothetical protein
VQQRVALASLPPRPAAWRYQRGVWTACRRHSANAKPKGSQAGGAAGACLGHSAAGRRTLAGTVAPAAAVPERAHEHHHDEDDDDVAVPDTVDARVGALLAALADKDTVVRWSAAKGVGRVAERLPRALADDVIAAVLAVLGPGGGSVRARAWHGGCLALAELARRGLLLPPRVADAAPLLYQVRFNGAPAHIDIIKSARPGAGTATGRKGRIGHGRCQRARCRLLYAVGYARTHDPLAPFQASLRRAGDVSVWGGAELPQRLPGGMRRMCSHST